MIRVLLADDQAVVRAGFRVLVGIAPDTEVVGEAADGAAAVGLARSQHADVVLMDIRMPGTDGIEATRQIVADPGLAGVRVIIPTTNEEDVYVFEAIHAGASGFLAKDIEPEDLVAAIRVVARGDALLAPSVTRKLIAGIAGRGAAQRVDASALSVLTEREPPSCMNSATCWQRAAAADRPGPAELVSEALNIVQNPAPLGRASTGPA